MTKVIIYMSAKFIVACKNGIDFNNGHSLGLY